MKSSMHILCERLMSARRCRQTGRHFLKGPIRTVTEVTCYCGCRASLLELVSFVFSCRRVPLLQIDTNLTSAIILAMQFEKSTAVCLVKALFRMRFITPQTMATRLRF